MGKSPHFNPEIFQFLQDLRNNNNGDWFRVNKERFTSEVRDPLLRFIEDFAPRLRNISPHYLAEAKPVGGSLTRMNRDVRFAVDKSPYKTMAGALFRHERGRVEPAPAFLLHLEPGQSFAGIGVHAPDSPTLAKIRQRIASHPDEWRAIISDKPFRKRCTLMAESLQRPPRGYPADHPCIEDLKRKHICTTTPFSDQEVCAGNFLDVFTATCSAASRFMEYLTVALGLNW